MIRLLVALGARGADAGALVGVEHPALDGGGVGVDPHEAAQGVDFPDDVALGEPPDGRVARHLAEGVEVLREQGDAATEPGRGKGGLDSGVSGSDDGDVIHCGMGKHVLRGTILPEVCDRDSPRLGRGLGKAGSVVHVAGEINSGIATVRTIFYGLQEGGMDNIC